MFRLIPFKKLSDVCGYTKSIDDLYEDALSKDKILIQDTKDMVIESYTIKQLKELELRYDIHYENFTTVDVCRDDELFAVGSIFLGIDSEKYLNGDLKVSCGESFNFPEISEEYADCFAWSLNVSYKNNKFKLSFILYRWEDLDKSLILMCINDIPVTTLNDCAITKDQSVDDEYAYFDLVQVCKTKDGFDFVISLQYVDSYIGFSLTNDLVLSKFVNLEFILRKEDKSKANDLEKLKADIAKRKLTSNWSGCYV